MREDWYSSEAMVERWSGKETPENLCFPNLHFCYVTLSCLFLIRLKFSLFRAIFLDFTCCQLFGLNTWFTGSLFRADLAGLLAMFVAQMATSKSATILYIYVGQPAWFDCRPDLICSLGFKRVQLLQSLGWHSRILNSCRKLTLPHVLSVKDT